MNKTITVMLNGELFAEINRTWEIEALELMATFLTKATFDTEKLTFNCENELTADMLTNTLFTGKIE